MHTSPRIPKPANEIQRLAVTRQYLRQIDDEADAALNVLVEIAADLCRAPYALVTLVEDTAVVPRAAFGLELAPIPRDDSYCALSILDGPGMFIEDLRQDPRTACMPITQGGRSFRMYAGINLIGQGGYPVGVLCVLDSEPRSLTPMQKDLLMQLGRLVVNVLELARKDRTDPASPAKKLQ